MAISVDSRRIKRCFVLHRVATLPVVIALYSIFCTFWPIRLAMKVMITIHLYLSPSGPSCSDAHIRVCRGSTYSRRFRSIGGTALLEDLQAPSKLRNCLKAPFKKNGPLDSNIVEENGLEDVLVHQDVVYAGDFPLLAPELHSRAMARWRGQRAAC